MRHAARGRANRRIFYLLFFRADPENGLALFMSLGKMAAHMRSLFCLVAIAMVGCSFDPLGEHDPLSGHDPLNGHLVDEGTHDAQQTNYPPEKLKEQTFVLSNPVAYQSKRDSTSDEIHSASKLGAKLARSTAAKGLIAVPVNSAQGATTIADVMVYDTARHDLLNNTVYRFSYTPPAGQTLQLDGVTAVFQTGGGGGD
jgi:hypothetical protein